MKRIVLITFCVLLTRRAAIDGVKERISTKRKQGSSRRDRPLGVSTPPPRPGCSVLHPRSSWHTASQTVSV